MSWKEMPVLEVGSTAIKVPGESLNEIRKFGIVSSNLPKADETVEKPEASLEPQTPQEIIQEAANKQGLEVTPMPSIEETEEPAKIVSQSVQMTNNSTPSEKDPQLRSPFVTNLLEGVEKSNTEIRATLEEIRKVLNLIGEESVLSDEREILEKQK